MKKIGYFVLCIVLSSVLCVSALAHEGHDHGEISDDTVAFTTFDPLDQDGDGVPDYLDNLVDLDGDGLHDISPNYQKPANPVKKKPLVDTPWFVILIILVFFGVVISTVYLKIKTKGSEDAKEEQDV